jgi:hypothetical protein
MRCSAWSSLAISVCSALALAGPAGAHIDATPAFIPADGIETISLVAHNDRALEMDAFAVSVSPGLRIESVGDVEGWSGSIDGSTATWTGGRLAGGEDETFNLDLEAVAEPGPVSLEVAQQYPDDRSASWPVTLTVVPADEASTGVWLYVVVAVGLVLAGAGALLAWRRRDAVRR